jgi:hypothetical protein
VRVIAYQQTYLAWNLSNLGPGYDCSGCTRPERTGPTGCPACHLTIVEDGYSRLVSEQIRAGLPEGADLEEWSTEDLERDVGHVRQMMRDNDKKIDPNWPMRVVGVARAIKAGEMEAQAAIEWELSKRKPEKGWM